MQREMGGRARGLYRGVAFESDLLIVKLGTPLPDSFPKTAQLMEALDFVTAKAVELGRPLAVNISFGNTYGAHDGTGLLETFMDSLAASADLFLLWEREMRGQAGATPGGGSAGMLRKEAQEAAPSRMWSWLWRLLRRGWGFSCGNPMRISFPSP